MTCWAGTAWPSWTSRASSWPRRGRGRPRRSAGRDLPCCHNESRFYLRTCVCCDTAEVRKMTGYEGRKNEATRNKKRAKKRLLFTLSLSLLTQTFYNARTHARNRVLKSFFRCIIIGVLWAIFTTSTSSYVSAVSLSSSLSTYVSHSR